MFKKERGLKIIMKRVILNLRSRKIIGRRSWAIGLVALEVDDGFTVEGLRE